MYMIEKLLIISGIIISNIGISLDHFRKDGDVTHQSKQPNDKIFIDSIDAKNIEANLKYLTSRAHLAGSSENLDLAEFIEHRWKNDSLRVTKPTYNVLLSYPDDNMPNQVTLTDGSRTVIIRTAGIEKVYDPTQPKTVNPFLAYTPNGTVNSTKVYYANYGLPEDFERLVAKVGNDSLNGSIIIVRYGQTFRADKIMNAQRYGAVGAILYSDPAECAPFGIGEDQTYNQTWYMPPSGTQRGTCESLEGDPLTPIYPSTNYMYRIEEENNIFLPKIPAQVIGYGEAQVIFQYLQGDVVEDEWRGSLPDVTYRYGGELRDTSTIEIKTHNRRERKDIYNVIGIMKGEIEPDRYVVIGNHRDAWNLGAIDPSSATAMLLEITRVFGQMYKNGFRPRRTLMFCSWDAEEYGLIGSVEYVQEYVKVLGARVVSYINIDSAVKGNYTLDVKASPLLFDIIVEASKIVPSAYDPIGQTVYDKWMNVRRNNVTNEPNIAYGLGAASDYFAFNQLVGCSSLDATYMFNPTEHGNITIVPLYHTAYDTFSVVKQFVDRDFLAHRTMGQFIGVLALFLSDRPILPLNASRYTIALRQALSKLKPTNLVILEPLRVAIDEFDNVVQAFVVRSKSLNVKRPHEIRAYNDQLLQLERAFLNPLGQGTDFTDLKHIVYGPSKHDQYATYNFPSIADAIANGNQAEIEQQIAITTYFVRGASSTLKEFDNFFL